MQYNVSPNNATALSFQRSLRLPQDGKDYPLPPGLGAIPVFRARDYPRTEEAWRERDEFFFPLYKREAMWVGIQRTPWKPCAIQSGLGQINAVTGRSWSGSLSTDPQNYLVCPPQLWLDGVNVGQGRVRQFIAVPTGSGYSVESQLSSCGESGGINLLVYEPKQGRFPDCSSPATPANSPQAGAAAFGLGAGGLMRQEIYRDPHGIDIWEERPSVAMRIHIVEASAWSTLTGEPLPPTPVSTADYINAGLPWFELYGEGNTALQPTKETQGIRSVESLDHERGLQDSENEGVPEIPEERIWKLLQ